MNSLEDISGSETPEQGAPDHISVAAAELKEGQFSRDDIDVYLSAVLPKTKEFSLSTPDAQDVVLTAVSEVAARVPSVANGSMNAHTLALGLTAALSRTARISHQTYGELVKWLSSDHEEATVQRAA